MNSEVVPTGSGQALELVGRHWLAVGLCCLVAMLDGADGQALAVAAPSIARDLTIGAEALGLVFSASLLGAAVGALAGGALADRFGARRPLLCCTLLFGALQFATAYVDRLETLVVLRTVAGLGLGGATPCFLALAAAGVPPSYRARTLGVVWAFFPAGALVGGLVNGWLVTNRSWHDVFIYSGAVTIGVALLLAIPMRADAATRVKHDGAKKRNRLHVALLRDRLLLYRAALLCCTFFGVFATLAGVVVWMPSLLVMNGFAASDGGALLSWHAVGALVSIALGGFLLERLGPRLLTVVLLAGTAVLAMLGISLTAFWPAAIAMMLLGVFLGVAASSVIGLAGALFPHEVRSGGLGLSMGTGRLGQMILPYLMGIGIARGVPGASVLLATAALPLLSAAAAHLLSRSLETGPAKLT